MTSFTFNGQDFSGLLRITDVQRPLLPPVSNITVDMGSRKGVLFNYNKYGSREITINYTMVAATPAELQDKKNLVAGLLYTKEPQPLVFSDAPEKYYLAVVDGDFNVEQLGNIGQGEIKFLIPDAKAYATEPKTATAYKNAAGVLEVEINNEGTEECPVNVEALFTSDNGVFAAALDDMVIQVGSMEEVDGHEYQQTDIVAKNSLQPSDKQNWEENSPNARTHYPIATTGIANEFGKGSWDWKEGSEGPTPVFPEHTAKSWIGPTLYRTFAENSNGSRTGNFEALWRCDFRTDKANQAGRLEFNLQNGEDVPFAVVLRDSIATGQELKCDLMIKPPVGDQIRHAFTIPLNKLKGSWFDLRFIREGDKFTFRFSDINKLSGDEVAKADYTYTKSFEVQGIADIPVDATTFWPHAKHTGAPVAARMQLTNFVFRWINVDKYSDDPNRYANGDVMRIDSEAGKVFLNDVPILNDVVLGSRYLVAPVGRSTIQFICSSFATQPTITATIREVFL